MNGRENEKDHSKEKNQRLLEVEDCNKGFRKDVDLERQNLNTWVQKTLAEKKEFLCKN